MRERGSGAGSVLFSHPFPAPTARQALGGPSKGASPQPGEVTRRRGSCRLHPGEHTGKTLQVLRPLKSAQAGEGAGQAAGSN